MHGLIMTGISTDVGKTVASAILTQTLKADYWKPIEAGGNDTEIVRQLSQCVCHPPAYILKHALSPHHAAHLEKRTLTTQDMYPPHTKKPLIIEGSGGLLVPLNDAVYLADLFCSWQLPWVLVSKHYLGSINHTLLSIEWLKSKKQTLLGVIFNGTPNFHSERIILNHTQCLGRILPQKKITKRTIAWHARKLAPLHKEIFKQSGTPSHSAPLTQTLSP